MRRRHWKAPPCSSGKAAYRTQGRALHALVVLRAGLKQSPIGSDGYPIGVYHCRCGAWHMTSQVRPGTVIAP